MWNRALATLSFTLPTSSSAPNALVLNDFYAQTEPRSPGFSDQSAPHPSDFDYFEVAIELSLHPTFCRSSCNSAPRPSVRLSILNILKRKSNSCYEDNSARFLSTAFPDRPYFGDHGNHFTRKGTRFRARRCFHPWICTFPNVTLIPNSLMIMVDLIICGWPDQKTAPGVLSVARKFLN